MGLWLIDSDLNRYDILTGNIPSGFPVDKKRKLIDLAFSHGAKDIGDQKVGDREIKIDSFLNGQTGGFVRMLFDCGDNNPVSDWSTVGGDALAAVEDTTYIKQGSKSMKLGVDASLDGGDGAWWGYSGSAIDLTNLQNEWLYLWIYFPTLDYLHPSSPSALYFYVGSDAGNRLVFAFSKSELSVGWNLIKLDFDNPYSIDGTVNWAAIDYIYVGVSETIGNTNDFDIYVDYLYCADHD